MSQTYQFENSLNHHPVHVDFVGGEMRHTGIAFEDYTRMSTHTHKLNRGRQHSSPTWAFNDTQLRQIIVRCVQRRVYMAGPIPQGGTDAERLLAAQKLLADRSRPSLVARIDRLCKDFMSAKQAGDTARMQSISPKVQECDTQLRLIDSAPKILAGVVYYYYRLGLDSVQVGQQLGITPPHVRALVWRLGRVAGQLGYGPLKTVTPKETTVGELTDRDYLVLAAKLRATGTSMEEIKKLFRCKSDCAIRAALRKAGLYRRAGRTHKTTKPVQVG